MLNFGAAWVAFLAFGLSSQARDARSAQRVLRLCLQPCALRSRALTDRTRA
jgi:hypothetical protein